MHAPRSVSSAASGTLAASLSPTRLPSSVSARQQNAPPGFGGDELQSCALEAPS